MWRDSTINCGVSCALASEKIPIYMYLKWEKQCCHFFSAVFNLILIKLVGNDDIHKSLDEFKIGPDPTPDHRVTCP